MRVPLLILAVLTAAALGAGAAPAAQPDECPPFPEPLTEACTIVIDDHFTDTDLCGFPVQLDVVGKIGYTPHYDREGNLAFESFRPNIKITATNPANGRWFTDRDVGLDKATFGDDGSIEVLSTAIHFKVRGSNHETLFRRIGLIRIHVAPDGTETVEEVGGNLEPEEDFPAIVCDFLSG